MQDCADVPRSSLSWYANLHLLRDAILHCEANHTPSTADSHLLALVTSRILLSLISNASSLKEILFRDQELSDVASAPKSSASYCDAPCLRGYPALLRVTSQITNPVTHRHSIPCINQLSKCLSRRDCILVPINCLILIGAMFLF